MDFRLFRSKRVVALVLGAILVVLLGAVPAKAQCMLTGLLGGGYCYDWGNRFSGRTVRIYPSGGREVEAHTPFGVMYGEWFDAMESGALGFGVAFAILSVYQFIENYLLLDFVLRGVGSS